MKKIPVFALCSALALAVAAIPAGASSTQTPGFTTVPVATPSTPGIQGQSLIVGTNVNITHKTGPQSETTIAVDPTNANHLLAASNDLTGGLTAQVYESTDGGTTWVNSNALPGGFCYDPWLDFNTNGDAFFTYECASSRTTQNVAYKLSGTTAWVRTTLAGAGSFPDRDMITTDKSSASPFFKSVYVGYDDANAGNAAFVFFSRTGTGGWTRSPQINTSGGGSIGVNAAVAPNGTVYASWLDWAGKKIWSASSSDGGQTWSTNHVVHNFRINTTGFFIFIPPQNVRGVIPMPFTAVAPAGSPNAGRLYVTYFDNPVAGGGNTVAFLVYSDDGGLTWSNEVQISTGTVTSYQFFTAIAVASDGTVGYSFYDSVGTPGNKGTNRYAAFSRNGGVSFGPVRKITTAPSNETTSSADGNQYGDYEGMAVSGTGRDFHAVWTDSRKTVALNEDMFTALVTP